MGSPDRRVRLSLVAVSALVLMSGCSGFSLETACLTCEYGIENATAGDLNVSVASSELEIAVREDESARWTVRANLTGSDIDELRSNPERVSRLAHASVTNRVNADGGHYTIREDSVSNVSGKMDGDTLVVEFLVPDAAERRFGDVLLFTSFHTNGENPSYPLGTDRVVVRGPPGTVVTHHPPNTTTADHGRAVVWQSSTTELVAADTYVAFAPDERQSTKLATQVAVVEETATWAGPETISIGVAYAAGLLGVLVAISRRWGGRLPIRRVGNGDSTRERFVDSPPVDLLAVAVLSPLLVVAVFSHTWRPFVDGLFVSPPLVPIGMFFALGVTIHRLPRVRRFLALSLCGIPFVMVSNQVVTPPPDITKPIPEFDVLLPFVGLLLAGVTVFYIGTRMAIASEHSQTGTTE